MATKINILLIISIAVNWSSVLCKEYGECLTPTHEAGKCISLQDCTELYNLYNKADLTAEDRLFLRSSQCGYFNQEVLVCCPDPDRIKGALAQFPDATKCGAVPLKNRIHEGNSTNLDEFPWMALIEYTKPGNVTGHHCGGTLISERYVVTAAHCVIGLLIPHDWHLSGVRLGEWDTTTNPDCEIDALGVRDCAPEHLNVPVERTIPHSLYDPKSTNQKNDIALLRLKYKVPIGDFIQPICLPRSAYMSSNSFTGESMDIAGWGKTEKGFASSVKLKAHVNVWSLVQCQRNYATQNKEVFALQICAGNVNGADSCNGDSGGPMMMQYREGNRTAFYLMGIVSYGPTPCGLQGWPGVYTRVGAYVSWIENNVFA